MKIIKHSVVLPSVGKMLIDFHNKSADLYEIYSKCNEFERQKEIKHLGLIATVFESAAHSRYEYLMLQCSLTDIIDKLYPGSSNLAQGKLSLGSKKYFGNDLLKSWFMLSNFGHLFQTIGDEKSMLIFASKQKGFVSTLLTPILDEDLVIWSKEIINDFSYTKFHHILSLRRIYKEVRDQTLKNELIDIYKLLLLPKNKIKQKFNEDKLLQLRRLYNTIRAITIVTIDGHYTSFPVSIDLMNTLISMDTVEHTYTDKFIFDSIKPILSTLHNELYLDKQVLSKQRAYEIEAIEYMNSLSKNVSSYNSIINKALTEGLINKNVNKLEHFARLEIKESMQSKLSFLQEFRSLQIIKKGCKGVESSLDTNPFTKIKYADFFIKRNEFSVKTFPRYVYNISKLIENQISNLVLNTSQEFNALLEDVRKNALDNGIPENITKTIIDKSKESILIHVWKTFKKDIYPSYRQLFWSILNYFIEDKYLLDIDSSKKEYDIFSLKLPTFSLDLIKDNINKAIEVESDEDRKHELKHLWNEVKRNYDGFIYTCLSRIIIYDPTKPPSERIISDIDSASIKISPEEIIIDLIESKNTSKTRENKALKDIRNNLIHILDRKKANYRVLKCKGFGAKLRIKINEK